MCVCVCVCVRVCVCIKYIYIYIYIYGLLWLRYQQINLYRVIFTSYHHTLQVDVTSHQSVFIYIALTCTRCDTNYVNEAWGGGSLHVTSVILWQIRIVWLVTEFWVGGSTPSLSIKDVLYLSPHYYLHLIWRLLVTCVLFPWFS